MQPAMCAAIDYSIPFVQVVPLIRAAGFEIISLGARPEHSGYDTLEGRRRIRQLIEHHGLRIDSVHAPFPEGDRLCSLDEAERLESLRHCQMALEAAQDLAVDIVVIHLNVAPDTTVLTQMMDQGIRSMTALSAVALATGVRMAVENSWGESYALMLDRIMAEFDGDPVGFCYDSGHENINRAGFPELEKHGPRLLTLHLHDNRGEDTHVLPYEGDTDWPRLMGTLHGLGYSGNLLLEVCIENSALKTPELFLAEAWQRAAKLLAARPDRGCCPEVASGRLGARV